MRSEHKSPFKARIQLGGNNAWQEEMDRRHFSCAINRTFRDFMTNFSGPKVDA